VTVFVIRAVRQAKRLIIGVIGFTVLVVGVAMVVLPGPAIIVIPAGLGILATEFVWARRLLKAVAKRFQKTKEEVVTMKPREDEEEYFARMEFERKKKIEDERQKTLAENEKKSLRELHYMKCPKCGMELIQIGYKGLKIDECSACKGIWLDAGEFAAVSKFEKTALDKLFDVFRSDQKD
jgi:uncharacterized protein